MKQAFVFLAALLLLTACGQPPTPNPNGLRIELITNPAPLKVGDAALIVNVTDKGGQPVEGAEVNISYGMTSMNMGITSGKATDEGSGRYILKTSFSHTGGVKLTVQVDKSGLPKGFLDTQLDVQ